MKTMKNLEKRLKKDNFKGGEIIENLNYKIISTGSKGNCVIIDNIMIDVGVPYKKIEGDLYGMDTLLITHIHTDHINLSTLQNIKKMFPRIKIIGNYEVAYMFPVDIISNDNNSIVLKEWKITPFKCIHDVVCQGWVLQRDDLSIIYATDTASLEFAPDIKYDYFFIESNHDEKKVKLIQGKSHKYGYDAWSSAMRHLSSQKSRAFYYMHRKSKESKFIELHQSARFY